MKILILTLAVVAACAENPSASISMQDEACSPDCFPDDDGGNAWTPETMAAHTLEYAETQSAGAPIENVNCRPFGYLHEGMSCWAGFTLPLLGRCHAACSWEQERPSLQWHLKECHAGCGD